MKKSQKKPAHSYLIRLGSEIKKVRNEEGLSLEVLGGEIGIDASNLQKIELGLNITLTTLLKLCIRLKIPPSKLFDKITWDLKEKDLDSFTTPRPRKKSRARRF